MRHLSPTTELTLQQFPNPIVLLDSPDNTEEPRTVIDTGAKAMVTNQLHIFNMPTFDGNDNQCPVKMNGATAKDVLIPSVTKGQLQIPAITLPGWTEVECDCSPWFTDTPLNEQDLLKATERKSDHSGPTVNNLFDKHPDHL